MPIELQVFAPFDFGRTYLSGEARRRLTEHLTAPGGGWKKHGRMLDLDEDFSVHHKSYHRDITADIPRGQLGTLPDSIVFERAEIWLQSTGISLVALTYHLKGLELGHYLRVCKGDSSHFSNAFRWIVRNATTLIGRWPTMDAPELRRDQRNADVPPHWTHGIFLHAADAGGQLLDPKLLEGLSSAEARFRDADIIVDAELHARFGWETSAITAKDLEEARKVSQLVRILGYYWEIHSVVDGLAATKIIDAEDRNFGNRTIGAALASARRFRRYAATLLDFCPITRLSMTDRFVHMIQSIVSEWHLDELKYSIRGKIDLLNLIYSEESDGRAERRSQWWAILAVAFAFVATFGVAADVVKYIDEPGLPVGLKLVYVLAPPVVLTSLIALARFWLRKHYF